MYMYMDFLLSVLFFFHPSKTIFRRDRNQFLWHTSRDTVHITGLWNPAWQAEPVLQARVGEGSDLHPYQWPSSERGQLLPEYCECNHWWWGWLWVYCHSRLILSDTKDHCSHLWWGQYHAVGLRTLLQEMLGVWNKWLSNLQKETHRYHDYLSVFTHNLAGIISSV